MEARAAAIAAQPPVDPDASIRLDLTHLLALAIDDSSTIEVDDALSVELIEGGRAKLWVHVADPSRYIQPGDPVEQEARRRTSSCYLPTGMIPMIPLSLAAGPMSLTADDSSAAVSFGALIEADGSFQLEDVTIMPSTVGLAPAHSVRLSVLEACGRARRDGCGRGRWWRSG